MSLYEGYLNDVEGIKVGHSQDQDALTGVSVIICEKGATGGVDVRGSAPGTRETDLFQGEKSVDKVHAIVLSGGSAYGLAASTGVMEYLEEKGVGLEVQGNIVPIVAQAVIFDLTVGNPKIRPDKVAGYEAAKNATSEEKRQGSIGAGTGATVGKILGPTCSMRGGLGSASVKSGDLVVSAIVVVNAIGDVYDFNGDIIAGTRNVSENSFINSAEFLKNSFNIAKPENGNTTIGVIATNAILTKSEGNKTAQLAQNALARRISPAHTAYDGDTIFTMATGEIKADPTIVGIMATEAMEKAILNGINSVQNK